MPKEITVLGWYGHSNIGDEAYRLAMQQIFSSYNLKFTDKFKANSGHVILGGGNVLNQFFLKQINKPNVTKDAMSIDVTESDDLSMFGKVISRNLCKNVKNLPDFTFMLRPNKKSGLELIDNLFKKHKADRYERVAVLAMNAFLMTRENSLARDHVNLDKVCFDLAKLMDSMPVSFILLPFGNGFPNNDRIVNSSVYAKCKFWKKNVLVYEELSVEDTLNICSAVDFSLCTRLHSLIFSCIGGTPFIDLTHHDKTKFFLESIGMSEWAVNYWKLNVDHLAKLIDEIISKQEIHRNHLSDIAQRNRMLLLEARDFLQV